MKRITNILSYLCLLLLLLVAACSDLEEIVVNMQGEEEVELTIQTNIPGLGGSTRTAPTEENITSITALAFDSDHELIKVAIEDVTISPSATPSTSGTYTVKVPVRTRRIHFIAKNGDAKFTEITDADYGKSDEALLKDRLTTDLHYWGKLDFDDAEDMENLADELSEAPNKEGKLTLYRNMAMLKLDTGSENDDYIAGLIHYNSKGTIAPYITTNSGGVAINDFGYQDGINHYIPKDDNGVSFITTDASDKNYGKVHYLFEEFNKKSDGFGEESDIVYVICNIGNKFYKVAFKPTSSSTDFYYIIRNKQYTIKIKEGATLGDAYAATEYEDALDLAPINNTKEVDIEILEEMDVYMFVDETGTATLNIPAGMTQLEIGYSQENFDRGGVNVTNIDAPDSQSEIELTSENENGQSETIRLWIDAYKESLPEEQTTWTLNIQLKEEYINEVIGSGDPSILQIQFLGEGTGMKLNQKLNVHIMLRETLGVTSAVSLPNKVGSEFKQVVNIPDFGGYDENFKLKVDDVESKYTITAPQGLPLVEDANGNYYEVEEGTQYTFTFALKEAGTVGDKHEIKFTATSEYHELTGTTTVTLIDDAVPDQDVYEIWVGDGNAWTGTENSVEFFGYKTTADSNGFDKNTTPPTGFRTTFYDALAVNGTTYSADNHKQQAMVMGSDDSFTFTIPAGGSRWLTMLVAANSGTPSINLTGTLANGDSWTTATSSDAVVPDYYNFGNGEIGTAGRLIRYELKPGTYTLQGSDAAAYLLYYMRVSKARPEMTDVAQPLLKDYTLFWSGGKYADTDGKGYLKISDEKHIVDEDNLTHTVLLKAENSLEKSLNLSNYTLSTTFDLYITQPTYTFVEPNDDNNNGSITIGNDNLDEYKNIVPSSELRLENNGGDYVLSGKIIEPDYKYSAFYDVLQLNQVEYEVKNPIVPALYNSMDGDKLTPVENWTTMDDAWAIGFFMPTPMPIEYASASDRPEIAISIPGWTKSDSGTSSGLGIVVDSGNKIYTLTTQDNSVHPRPGWTYKIQWADRASSTISPEIVNESSDVYFTYMGNIAKKVDVAVPEIEETPLNITLDFYADEDGDGNFENQGNSFNNLLLKLTDQTVASKVGLKATVTGDISTYDGETVVLTGDFPSYNASNSGWAIHWGNSRKNNGDIYYYGQNQNGTGLQFTIDANKQEQTYLIEWEFVPSTNNYQGYGDIGFTYEISAYADSPVKYNLTGDTQATIEFKNEPTSAEPDNTGGTTIWTGSQQWGDWLAGDYQPNYLAINYFLPAGTEIILNVTSANGGAVEMHDCTLTSLRLTSSNVTYPEQDDNCFNVGSGNTSPKFTVPSGGVNGLRINGSNVTITSVVVKYPNKTGQIFSYDFSDGQIINGWGENGKDNVSRSIGNENGNNYLILSNTGGFAQAAIDGEYEPGNYTLTFKVRGTASGNMNMIFQHHYDPSDTDPVYDETVGNSNPNPVGFTTEWPGQPVEVNITLNKGANRFLINYTDFTGDIYIDDLKLVRNN